MRQQCRDFSPFLIYNPLQISEIQKHGIYPRGSITVIFPVIAQSLGKQQVLDPLLDAVVGQSPLFRYAGSETDRHINGGQPGYALFFCAFDHAALNVNCLVVIFKFCLQALKAEHENIHRVVSIGVAFGNYFFQVAGIKQVDYFAGVYLISGKAIGLPRDDAVDCSISYKLKAQRHSTD